MKKIFLLFTTCLLISTLFAQENPETQKKKEPVNLSGRAKDHFLVQLGYTGWAGQPDSLNIGGFSKSINVYLMFDFPLKSNPKLSVGIGAGISSDQIRFKKTYVAIKETSLTLKFVDQTDTSHFKKVKLVTDYFEVPLEFRFTSNPMNSDKSFKFALGVKGGAMLAAHTRNKDLQNKNDNVINSYIMKESSKRFFRTTRLSAIARIGYGHFSVYGTYQITSLFKDAVGPQVKPWSIGLTLSGL